MNPDPISLSCFRLWREEANQEAVSEYVAAGRSTSQFSMLINANTSTDIIEQIAADLPGELSSYSLYIGKLFDWIDRLRWAYVPIWEDNDFALVLFSDRQRALYEAFEDQLKQSGEAI